MIMLFGAVSFFVVSALACAVHFQIRLLTHCTSWVDTLFR